MSLARLRSLGCIFAATCNLFACSHAAEPPPRAPEPSGWPTPRTAAPATETASASSAECLAVGRWRNVTPDVGESTITIAPGDGGVLAATEDGLGDFSGSARLSGRVLHVEFQTAGGYAGYYEWTLDASCNVGHGTLVFSRGGSGEHVSDVTRLP